MHDGVKITQEFGELSENPNAYSIFLFSIYIELINL